jgi:hypothetical protein
MVASTTSFTAMMALAALAAQVNGHGYMSDPAVTFLSTAGDPTQFIATIESSASGFSGTFSSDPATNTASFTTAFAASDYTSLKEFVTDLGQLISTTGATITCGLTDPDETAQALPDEYVLWAHSDSEGFTASHEGPCEIWCDETRVFQADDCAATYTTAPAQLPYDHDACLGSSQLTFYWLALHSSTWQVYANCAALESTTSTGATSSYAVGSTSTSTATSSASSASSASNSTSTSTTTSAPATTTSAPATTTSAPATTTAAPATTTATPTATTATPTATTAAPSTTTTESSAASEETDEEADTTTTTTSKCNVRSRK